ncbi:hypothetical protein BGX38DRAFT_1212930 [Terfezia claveryi]|nr:hypothetical protein BGX38DRAFT_1212930 [Terfezia claveryi]
MKEERKRNAPYQRRKKTAARLDRSLPSPQRAWVARNSSTGPPPDPPCLQDEYTAAKMKCNVAECKENEENSRTETPTASLGCLCSLSRSLGTAGGL